MKIDLHSHTVITKRIGFEYDYFLGMVAGARRNGLDALVLTEHFNTLRFHEVYDGLDERLPYSGAYYSVDGLRLYPGMEVDVAEGVHILLMGDRDAIREARAALDGHTERGSFVRFAELLRIARANGLVVNGAHPLRPGRELLQIDIDLARQVDLIDLNAKDLFLHGEPMQQAVTDLGRKLGVPVAAGSDAHHFLQLGSVWNEITAPCETAADIAASIRDGRFELHVSECLTTKVEAARIVKQTIKEYRLPA